MAKSDKEILFVEVNEPDEMRVNILESLKDIIENLQRFEKFKQNRRTKIVKIDYMGKIIKELNEHLTRLKAIMPEAKIRAILKTKAKTVEKIETIKATEKGKEEKQNLPEKTPASELQRLESELSDIEDKLRGLR